MYTQNKSPLLCLLIAAALLLTGCAQLMPTPYPTMVPGAVDTFVAQTIAALPTRTASDTPTATLTPTSSPTPTPAFTDTATPTETSLPPTATFILWPTPTFSPVILPSPIPTRAATATPASYQCQLISQTPKNGTQFKPNADFDAIWKVKNTGAKKWDKSETDYAYLSGTKMHKQALYDLPVTVWPGETVQLIVDMTSPAKEGQYTTTWSLKRGNAVFCTFTLTINVAK